jgi:hypothetical protein
MIPYLKTISRQVYQVVEDGAMSNAGLAEGRFIPVVVLNAPEGSELHDLIRIHQGLTGDADSTWSQPLTLFSPKTYHLEIHFTKPMDCIFAIEFDIKTQFVIIDGIMQSNGVWIQTGKPGDKVSQDLVNKVLIEIPNNGMEIRWEKRLHSEVKDTVTRKGKSKREINKIVAEKIKTFRTISNYRRGK